jgi:hypothetical protein
MITEDAKTPGHHCISFQPVVISSGGCLVFCYLAFAWCFRKLGYFGERSMVFVDLFFFLFCTMLH